MIDAPTLWAVYDEDGELVAVDVEARNAADALAQFSYVMDSWYAVPQTDTIHVIVTLAGASREETINQLSDWQDQLSDNGIHMIYEIGQQ